MKTINSFGGRSLEVVIITAFLTKAAQHARLDTGETLGARVSIAGMMQHDGLILETINQIAVSLNG